MTGVSPWGTSSTGRTCLLAEGGGRWPFKLNAAGLMEFSTEPTNVARSERRAPTSTQSRAWMIFPDGSTISSVFALAETALKNSLPNVSHSHGMLVPNPNLA